MHALTFAVSLITGWFVSTPAASGASTRRPSSNQTPIPFISEQEYSLSPEYDLDNTQSLFDISAVYDVSPTHTYTLQARPTTIYRPRSTAALLRTRLSSLHGTESEQVEWDQSEVLGPDVEDKHTLSQLARMTANAYALPGQKNWHDIDPNWNTVRHLPVLIMLLSLADCTDRAFPLVGKMPQTVFAVTSSFHRQPRPLSWRSRVRHCKARRPRRTSSTTIYYSRAAARMSTFLGCSAPCAGAIRASGGAITGV